MTLRRLLRGLPASVVLIAITLLAGCTADRDAAPTATPSPDLTRQPVAIATNAGPFDAGPIDVPASGALVGAWVKPVELTQPGRIEAISTWEAELGRKLHIVNTYRRWDDEFGTSSDRDLARRELTIMLSWASGDTRSITSGAHDALIRRQARKVKSVRKPVLLRFRWEMDRPNLRPSMWSGQDYIAAWRHVREIFAQERVRNASWVWCPTAEGFATGDAADFYPGDDAVDWTCVDVYAGSDFRPIGELMGPFLVWAARRPKPIIVGEFGVARAWGSAGRAAWLRDAARFFKANPQIKAVVYFESDPEGNGPKQQFSIADDPAALDAFTDLSHDPYFNPRG